MYDKKIYIYSAFVSKHNSNREKEVILLVIPNEQAWNYLTVKQLSVLLRDIKSKNNDGFYDLNCVHSFRTKNKLQSHKKVCQNKDFCNFAIFVILEFNQYK